MRVMNGFFSLAITATVAATLLLPVASPNAASGEDAIKQRRELMKSNGKNWKSLNAYAKKGKGTPADVAASAEAIGKNAGKILALFPKGTGRGDFSAKETRALPAIWKDWGGFEKAAKTLADESAKLVTVSKSGGKDAIAKQIGALKKNACDSCHKSYRGAKAK